MPEPIPYDQHEAEMTKLIVQRDDAEEALSQAYYLIMGRAAEWSNLFGYAEALEEIDDAQTVLREALKKAERDALPCQVLDVLDSERRQKAKADRYRAALERINKTLTVPAAEYVPAIQGAFQIIDTALAG